MQNQISNTKRTLSIVPYDPNWAVLFEQEKSHLLQLLATCAVQIDHIGSTSVQNLEAKPIIDILVEVTDLKIVDKLSSEFSNTDYEFKGENGIPGRRYIQKGGNNRSHHIHIFETGNVNLIRHRAFAKYLRFHSNIAKEYGLLKREAAIKSNSDMQLYMNLKNDFIQYHEQLAMKWVRSIG